MAVHWSRIIGSQASPRAVMLFDPPAELGGLGTACQQLLEDVRGEVGRFAGGQDLLEAFVVGLAA